jgi:tetratricopeptide (TPR) repeat protein
VEAIWQCEHIPGDERARGRGVSAERITIGSGNLANGDRLPYGTQVTAHIVKIGEYKAVQKELEGWQSCRPCGMTHDNILMLLRPGAVIGRGRGRLGTLVYEDGYHVLGTGTTMTLEQAVLECCRWGAPPSHSIERVVRHLFERLGSMFYVCSHVPPPRTKPLRPPLKLKEWLKQWSDDERATPGNEPERLRVRRETLGFLAAKGTAFLDPCDYLASVQRSPRFAPRMLRGDAHGDLHGRNVLVSLVEGEAALPAVFDYEDMGVDNLVGWDFVKLETELKVRALGVVFKKHPVRFAEEVYRFEVRLAECTEQMHNQADASLAVPDRPEAERLGSILLEIRKQARLCMGVNRARDRQWLEEYYFLLAAYGVRAGLFGAYQWPEVMAAYVSAGVAASRLSRPFSQLGAEVKRLEDLAKKAMKKAEPDRRQLAAEPDEMSHRPRLAFAKKWARCGNESFRRAAVSILRQLHRAYPHVLEIAEELALTLVNLKQHAEAEEVLRQIGRRYTNFSEETLCRWGRLWKDKGIEARIPGKEDGADVRGFFSRALEQYRRAYELRDKYYPGINVATLLFALGRTAEARKVAHRVLASLDYADGEQEMRWITATRAEALLLLKPDTPSKAEEYYRQAVRDQHTDAQTKAAMRRHVELIADHSTGKLRRHWTESRMNQLFGTDTRPKSNPGRPRTRRPARPRATPKTKRRRSPRSKAPRKKAR